MTTYEEICLNYFGDKISLENAIAKVQALPQSWQETAWKNKHAIILRSSCEICETSEDLQIQHTRFPTDTLELKEQFTHQLLAKAMKGFKVDIGEFNTYKDTHISPINGCSECLTEAINGQCPSCNKNISSESQIPVYKIPGLESIAVAKGLNGKNLKTVHDLFISHKQTQIKSELEDQFKFEIDDYAFRQSYTENIRYLSLIDAVTICKGCIEEQKAQQMDHSILEKLATK